MTVGDQPFTESAGPDVNDVDPVDVRILEDMTRTERVAPDFGSSGTFTLQLPGAAQPVQVLQRRIKRNKARILVTSFGGTSTASSVSIANTGTATNPGANTVLTSVVVPQAGIYTANWNVILAGTLGATDRNNVVLQVNGVTVATANSGINTGTLYSQLPDQISVPAGATVQLLIPVANAAAVYAGSLSLLPAGSVGAATSAVFHNRPDPLTNPNLPSGVGIQVLTTPFNFDWESQQPLYGVGVGGLVTVSVIDETYE